MIYISQQKAGNDSNKNFSTTVNKYPFYLKINIRFQSININSMGFRQLKPLKVDLLMVTAGHVGLDQTN